MDNFIAKKKKVTRRRLPASNDYLVDLNLRLGRFKRDFGERTVATIGSAEIEDWLDSLKDERTGEYLSPTSQGNYHRALTVLFAYAVKGMFAKQNPLANIDRPGGDSAPGILSIEQAARLLGCASSEILPYIAIGLFAGLRASELERLRWEHVDFEENEISVINLGGRHKSRRHVDMSPNLREWLLPLRKISGTIMPENFRKYFDAVREAAGVIPWPGQCTPPFIR